MALALVAVVLKPELYQREAGRAFAAETLKMAYARLEEKLVG